MKPEETLEDVMKRIEQKGSAENPFQPIIDLYKNSSAIRVGTYITAAGVAITSACLVGIALLKSFPNIIFPGQTQTPYSQPAPPITYAPAPTQQAPTAQPEIYATSVYPSSLFKVDRVVGDPSSPGNIVSATQDLKAGDVMYLSASHYQVGSTICENNSRSDLLCVYLYQAAKDETMTVDYLIDGHAQIIVTDQMTLDELLANRQQVWWLWPNCGNGCAQAQAYIDYGDGKIIPKTFEKP